MAHLQIKYRPLYNWKYELRKDYVDDIPIKPPTDINENYIALSKKGHLVIKKGYAWDGPSGPTLDTPNFMRGSLVHDAMYQLLRLKHDLGGGRKKADRKAADNLLYKMCRDDGMSRLRAWFVYRGLRWFGRFATEKSSEKDTNIDYVAP
ncbi:MAG: DUF1353 domain-containing protein [Planctomycetota bacterium]|nr:DUF1353 domain-containing protein [Planctomycetota bacterium]